MLVPAQVFQDGKYLNFNYPGYPDLRIHKGSLSGYLAMSLADIICVHQTITESVCVMSRYLRNLDTTNLYEQSNTLG